MLRRALALIAVGLLASVTRPAGAQNATPATICQIQGSGPATGMKDARVEVEGVVTADFVETAEDGFFVQAPSCDDDAATSDGIWVYDGNRDADVSAGQLVRVTGRVAEHYDLTEIVLDTAEVITTGIGVVTPVAIDPPADRAAAAVYLEAREAMLVDPGPLRVVGATNHFGEAYAVPAGSDARRVFRDNDTGQRLGLAFPSAWRAFNFGDEIGGAAGPAVGPLTYTYENFKVAVTPASAEKLAVRPNGLLEPGRAAPAGPGELTLAAYNLENFFDPYNDPGADEDSTPTMARYVNVEVPRRARSIARFLGAPDIVAVEEVEKRPVLEDLVRHPELAGFNYGTELVEGDDGRGIDVGVIYRRGKVRLLSTEQAKHCGPLKVPEPDEGCTQANGDPGWLLYSRPPLVLRFQVIATGGRLTVVVNHFKSKSGGDAATTPTRVAMAQHNLELFARLKAEEPEVPVFIVGDLNDFPDSAPLRRLTEDGRLADLHAYPQLVSPNLDYTYVFNGVSQVLDYILAERDLVDRALGVRAFGPVHVNADFGAPADDDDDPEAQRVSDHDPLLARIEIGALPPGRSEVYLPVLMRAFDVWDPGSGGDPGTAIPHPTDTARPPTDTPRLPTDTPRPATATRPLPSVTPTSAAGAPPGTPLKIDTIFFDGEEPMVEGDEFIAFTNVSGGAVFLTGWKIVSVQGNQVFDFPSGFQMAAGQSCRVYTDEDHPEHCGLNWRSPRQGVWANTGDKAEIRDAGGRVIDWYCYGSREADCRS